MNPVLTHRPEPALSAAISSASDLVFDVDLTLTFRQKGLSPELSDAIARSGKRCGIATSRALDELDESINLCGRLRAEVFRGPIVFEDGALVVMPGSSVPTLLVSPTQIEAVEKLRQVIRAAITPLDRGDRYAQLADIRDPLVHLPSYAYQASLSLWQKRVGDTNHFHRIMDWVLEAATGLGVRELLEFQEIGDGTLRAAVPGRNKGQALRELHDEGHLNLSKLVYFGDGRNDLPAAMMVKQYGGTVVCVDRHCAPLLAMADFAAPHAARGPHFVLEALRASSR